MDESEQLSELTRLLHAGQPPFGDGSAPVNPAVVRTSTVRFESMGDLERLKARRTAGETVCLYGRHGTETHRALETALCALEGARQAWLTPSGLAAITLGLVSVLGPGDHILVTDNVYDPVQNRIAEHLLLRFGIEVSYFHPASQTLESCVRPNTRLLYAESPGSILLEVLDLPALVRQAHAAGLLVMVDNTWSAGYLQRPLDFGVDMVASALTKYPGGHSDVMQGALMVRDESLVLRINRTYEALGYSVSADDASLILRGVRTLPVRMEQHARNALGIARWLAVHPAVEEVYCPALESHPGHAIWKRDFRGTNGLVTIRLRTNDAERLDAFADALTLFAIGGSWGGYESLVMPVADAALANHQAWRSGQERRLGGGQSRSPGVARLHIGLEAPDDLIADLQQALGCI